MRSVTKLLVFLGLPAMTIPGAVLSKAEGLPLDSIRLPPGFEIAVYAEMPGARSLTIGTDGTVYVSSPSTGKVFALIDERKDGKAERVVPVVSDLNFPNGIAFREGALYVAETSRILRYDGIDANRQVSPQPVVVTDRLPPETHHGWRYIAFGPDDWLYVPIGAPCNICEPDPRRHANIMRMKPDGSQLEVYAMGVRNSVGIDWNPVDRTLWFTDNGRDRIGDDTPSCELNHAPKPGMNFGYPYCHEGDLADPEYGSKRACREFTPPVAKLGAHVAPLGMRFYTGAMFPAEYRDRIFVAEHGSWNRSKKSGYRVVSVAVANGKLVKQEVFAQGWLRDETNWGRPVDVLVMPDGALLVSDDQAGAVYRITYRAP
jgi:glucose/arabinose dehydrogenase